MSTGYGNRIDFAQTAEPIILNGDLTNDLLPGGQTRFEVFPCKQAANYFQLAEPIEKM